MRRPDPSMVDITFDPKRSPGADPPRKIPVQSAVLSLYIGDSDAVGWGSDTTGMTLGYTDPIPGGFVWGNWDATAAVDDRIDEPGSAFLPITANGGSSPGGAPGPYLGAEFSLVGTRQPMLQKQAASSRGLTYGMVKVAITGAALGNGGNLAVSHSPGAGTLYSFAQQELLAAMAFTRDVLGLRTFFDCIYMSIGSNDANALATYDGLAEGFAGNVAEYQQSIANALGLSTVPVVMVRPRGLAAADPDRTKLVQEQADMAAKRIPGVSMIDVDGLPRLEDNLHMNAQAQYLKGQMLANARAANLAPLQEVVG